MQAIILGAGYGTRLYPLTKDRPKPLLPVGDCLIIEHILLKVEEIKEIEKVYIISNAKFYDRYCDWQKWYNTTLSIKIINDDTATNEDRLGAILDIQFALDKARIKDDVLIIAGDNVIDFDLNEFIKFAVEKHPAVALKDLKSLKLISQYSSVRVNKECKIENFEEKPANPKSTLISIGIYYFSKQNLKFIGEYLKMRRNPDAPGYFIEWLHKRTDVFGYTIKGDWFDIGDIDSYNNAIDFFKRKKVKRSKTC